MKKTLLPLMIFAVVNFTFSQIVNIPDANFKTVLVGNASINTNSDTEIQVAEANAFTGYIYCGGQSIADLTGIESFVNLSRLYCNNNQLTNLDVSSNTVLERLYCYSNQLTSLDVTTNIDLEILDFGNNNISSINLLSNDSLEHLNFVNNSLMSIDVSNNTVLASISARGNNLTGLDISNNTVLTTISCYSNSLSALDVSNNLLLKYITCFSNNITSLDVSNNLLLESFSCSSNNLTSLDVSNNLQLEYFSCSNNNLTSIDVSNNILLENLLCSNINISNLNVNNNVLLEQLICTDNLLTNINISANLLLTDVRCSNNQISNLNTTNNTLLRTFYCNDNLLSSINLTSNNVFKSFNCSNNQLTVLNVANGNNSIITNFQATGNPSLTCIQVDSVSYSTTNWTSIDAASSFSLNCSYPCIVNIPDANFKTFLLGNSAINTNNDTEIQCSEASAYNGSITCVALSISDLTGIESFTNITTLVCYNNSLNSLDVSNNTALIYLNFGKNSISNIDLSQNVNLKEVNCPFNNLTSIDVSQNVDLRKIWCHSNILSGLDFSQNSLLTKIECQNNLLLSLNLSQNMGLVWLKCNNNLLYYLNVSNGNNTNVTDFNAENNQNLTCIQVDDVVYSTANWSEVDNSTSFSLLCTPPCFVNIPDANFKAYLVGNSAINTNNDTEIQCSEATAFTGIINCQSLSISDLTGIEMFTSVTTLKCNGNSLTSLDVSNNLALTELWFSINNIDSIDVTNNTALTKLVTSGNPLGSLDVSNNTALEFLACNVNLLSTIDLSNNIALTSFVSNSNMYTHIDLSNNVNLSNLSLQHNLFTSFNLTNNLAIETFYCAGNNLNVLNVSHLPLLWEIYCENNDLVYLNVANGNNTNFTYMYAENNPSLTCIEVDDVTYSTSNWTDIDAIANFSLDCGLEPCSSSFENVDAFYCEGENYTSPNGQIFNSDTMFIDTILNTGGCDSIITITLTKAEINTTISQVNNSLEVTTGFDSYQWYDINGEIIGEENAIFYPTMNRDYYCEIGMNGCFENSDNIYFVATGIENLTFQDLNIFPNPTKDVLKIQTKEKLTSIVLKDLTGKTIQEFEPATKQINVSEIAKGIYFLELSNSLNMGVFKIIKQ